MSERWAECLARAPRVSLNGDVLRLVESQEQVATNRLVDTLSEQALLEEMLEAAKPAVPSRAAALDYLLATPFRYPPLRHGSRFGRRTEPSLFYASRTISAVLAECAYYRCVFWAGMSRAPADAMTTQHSLFEVPIATSKGLRLQVAPFDGHRDVLTNRVDYSETQTLGTELRAAGIEAFEYVSARDPGADLNVALFAPGAFAATRPTFIQEWLCETTDQHVRYYSRSAGRVWWFEHAQFLVDGRLPAPAI
jgi:hypothetical protein